MFVFTSFKDLLLSYTTQEVLFRTNYYSIERISHGVTASCLYFFFTMRSYKFYLRNTMLHYLIWSNFEYNHITLHVYICPVPWSPTTKLQFKKHQCISEDDSNALTPDLQDEYDAIFPYTRDESFQQACDLSGFVTNLPLPLNLLERREVAMYERKK